MRYIIIGGGPTGLGAAERLSSFGTQWHLYEAEDHPGGLSASFAKDGFVWDLGGHVLFSHYNYFDMEMDLLLDSGNWLVHRRKAFIRLLERWIPYPLQNNIHRMPQKEMEECIQGLRIAAAVPAAKPVNFEQWINVNSGSGLARLFMMPYNRKVWSTEPSAMSASWLGERVPKPDLDKILNAVRNRKDDDGWGPNNVFRFPRYGGTGAIWKAAAARLDQSRITYGAKAVRINPATRQIWFADGHSDTYDRLISTMPLDRLVRIAGLEKLESAASGLMYTSAHIVGLGLSGDMPDECQSKTWAYFPEKDFNFYRVTMFSNYSPNNAPESSYSLMAEVSLKPGERLLDNNVNDQVIRSLSRAGMISNGSSVRSVWNKWLKYSYPVPTKGRDRILSEILPELEELGIYSRGRFGAWKYEVANMDHSYAQGREIAERLVSGIPETTINNPDAVNSAGAGNREPLTSTREIEPPLLQKNVA